ncbi:MAG: hypothetical protein OEU36_21170 [Gammaproteobacteria bacterium]|nr:hypothetical protein [Gammaproteobacteria bacterium]
MTQDNLQAISFLAPNDVEAIGHLPEEAICGFLGDQTASADNFVPNRAFIEFMHQVIREHGPLDPEMQAVADEQKEGWLYVIDLRTPDSPQGHVPVQDIVGGFEVRDGQISADGYWANDKHVVLSDDGLVELPPQLAAALVEALKKKTREEL